MTNPKPTLPPPHILQAPNNNQEIISIGTRKSQLAIAQAEMIIAQLETASPGPQYKLQVISTMADENQVKTFLEFNSKSIWTEELERLLVEGKVDVVVHCLKDMPTTLPPSCILSTIPLREDPRDVLVMKLHSPYNSLDQLPPGSIIGTSSIRRKAQIAHFYPHLKCVEIRGNLQTRLRKLDDNVADVAAGDDKSSSNNKQNYDCLILAAAGLKRIGLEGRISGYLSLQDNDTTNSTSVKNNILHAPGQGALGLEIRHSDARILKLLSPLNHIPTAVTCSAERSFLKALNGGCSAPVGVESCWDEMTGMLELRGQVLSVDDGEKKEKEIVEGGICEVVGTVEEAEGVGERLARRLIGLGADRILGRVG
ncbi:Porphobilinogen deaminase [Sphaerulina musiva]